MFLKLASLYLLFLGANAQLPGIRGRGLQLRNRDHLGPFGPPDGQGSAGPQDGTGGFDGPPGGDGRREGGVLKGFMEGWLEDLTLGELSCDVPLEPECAWNLRGDAGVWVCRTLYNPFTGEPSSETDCVNPEWTVATTDICGFCEGFTPEVCECPCETRLGEEGVLVELTKPNGNVTERCFETSKAVTAVNRLEEISCKEVCD